MINSWSVNTVVLCSLLPMAWGQVDLVVRVDADTADALVTRPLKASAFGLPTPGVRVEENGVALPSQAEADRVVFRLPGLTSAATPRRVSLRAGEPASPATRVRTSVQDGVVRIENDVYAVEHEAKRNGGLPCRVTFRHTGRTEELFTYNDRVYDGETRRCYWLGRDPAPVVEVRSTGPLEAVVEVAARYLDDQGNAPASQPSARYRFRYTVGSPVVEVQATVEQMAPFAWSELHFLELNTKRLDLGEWFVCDPESRGRFENRETSTRGGWGALLNEREAIGLRAGQVTVYDGFSGYGNYLHGDWITWSGCRHVFTGCYYLGPAGAGGADVRRALAAGTPQATAVLSTPAVEAMLGAAEAGSAGLTGSRAALYRWQLSRLRKGLETAADLAWTGAAVAAMDRVRTEAAPTAAGVEVESTSTALCAANPGFALAFEREGTAVGLGSLWHAEGQRELVRPVLPATAALWQLEFRAPDFGTVGAVILDASTAACEWRAERVDDGARLRLQWTGLSVGEERGVADVEVTVRVPAAGSATEWRIRVANRSARVGLWSVTFPRLGNLAVSRAGNLAVPMGWGQLYRDASRTGHYDGDYPNGWATMPFASLYDSGVGVYLAAHDAQAWHKRLVLRPHPEADAVSFEVVQYPAAMAAPGTAYESPYPVVVATHAGDWYDASRLYRAWAMAHSQWFPRQPLAANPDTPEWLKRNPLWCQAGGDPKDVVPRVKRFREFFGVPMAFHWYSWHQIPFDDHYPEYFPPKEGFREAVADLRASGVQVMPYINGRLFDSRTDSWTADSAQDFCALGANGQAYTEVYGKSPPLSPMCPATPYWQGKIAGIVERLVGEFGVSGVYIDQIGAAGVAPCFNPRHGHGAGGAASWVPGYRQLLAQTRKRMRAVSPDSFLTTEDAAEPYQGGIDAFLMCNQTRAGLVPMFPAVYGGRVLTFGRYIFEADAKASLPFITKVGEMFVFGAQLGWLDSFVLDHPKEAGYMKRLAETRLEATRYLALGEMLRPPQISTDAPPVHTKWDLWGSNFAVEMPAILGSAWRADDGSAALVLTNLTDGRLAFRWRHGERQGQGEIEGLSALVVPVP